MAPRAVPGVRWMAPVDGLGAQASRLVRQMCVWRTRPLHGTQGRPRRQVDGASGRAWSTAKQAPGQHTYGAPNQKRVIVYSQSTWRAAKKMLQEQAATA